MALTPVENGIWKLPCLSCGSLLNYEVEGNIVRCSCGIGYDQEILAKHREPGKWREWMAMFACACGKVTVVGESVEIERHRCRMGQVPSWSQN